MSRPQIGIDRLPVRRLSNEQKEAMNCKSCRKRKIKCNRLRPSCEACQVFQCPCIYDAIPKKRGPKTDVLEALVKRVNQMEKALEAEGKAIPPHEDATATDTASESVKPVEPGKAAKQAIQSASTSAARASSDDNQQTRHHASPQQQQQGTSLPSHPPRSQPTIVHNIALLDVYFNSFHNKPYYILDEAATRQRWQSGQLSLTVVDAISAVTTRYAPNLVGGYNAAVRMSEDCAMRARATLDVDEPSIENIQVALLLCLAYFQAGKGKKSYMLLSTAISMAFAQGLHRELPAGPRISTNEREGRRRLFWTCYILDRFVACGSKRPSLINDESIALRLPAWQSDSPTSYHEGNFFSNGLNIPLASGPVRLNQSSAPMLIEIVRVLGITNRYLAAGGVKGDSHFPWHAQSNLSRIRHDLDSWATYAQGAFTSLNALYGQPESSTLVLSKTIYHLIHCLIYRPFLPLDLTELAGTGQHQSWQMEATNLCFSHANAIAELVEIGRVHGLNTWPAFVGYCLSTAGTVHVHGALYTGREGDMFARSADFLSKEMAHLSDLRGIWAGVQHQREVLQMVYGCHAQLVKSLASNPLRFSPVFQMEDFFDRYPGQFIDGAHVTFADVVVEALHESIPAYTSLSSSNAMQWPNQGTNHPAYTFDMPNQPTQQQQDQDVKPVMNNRKRRRTIDPAGAAAAASTSSTASVANMPPRGAVPRTSDPILNNQSLSPNQQQDPPQPVFMSPPQPPHHQDPSTAINDPTSLSNPFSTSFNFSPWATSTLSLAPGMLDTGQTPAAQLDSFFSLPQTATSSGATPGALSANGSTHTESDQDPFMSLLEQLAENEQSHGGPSDLDFFLSERG
ncbi:hypothetical protein AAFC00_003718 [Neodothiora populina]|uniref:Zn(2)-C6 fungal-type domain-containing protein n=1 Tax=Neodothiora populina TaxID=2781224 RepID=A0ABR3PF76_9PEZI